MQFSFPERPILGALLGLISLRLRERRPCHEQLNVSPSVLVYSWKLSPPVEICSHNVLSVNIGTTKMDVVKDTTQER